MVFSFLLFSVALCGALKALYPLVVPHPLVVRNIACLNFVQTALFGGV